MKSCAIRRRGRRAGDEIGSGRTRENTGEARDCRDRVHSSFSRGARHSSRALCFVLPRAARFHDSSDSGVFGDSGGCGGTGGFGTLQVLPPFRRFRS